LGETCGREESEPARGPAFQPAILENSKDSACGNGENGNQGVVEWVFHGFRPNSFRKTGTEAISPEPAA